MLISDTDSFLADLESMFSITVTDYLEISGNFQKEMRLGLTGEKSSLKMIPSFVCRPNGAEKGKFFVLDLGGTNIRILAVELDGNGNSRLLAVSRFVVPHQVMCGTGEELFDFIADCIRVFMDNNRIDREQSCELAFTFSFPVDQSSVASGKLIEWTKGFTATGVAGMDVVALLSEALLRKGLGFVNPAALANDTVGTLVAKAYSDSSCDMGVILGTGTNACYPENRASILKYKDSQSSGEMIVNMEWGGFDCLKMNVYDRELDCASCNPGLQQLEKMVSGMYLGEIARRIIIEMMSRNLLFSGISQDVFSEEYILRTEQLSRIAEGADISLEFGFSDVSEADREAIRKICRIVSTRSARIAATAIAAVISWMDEKLESDHTVAIDGSLFEKYPRYSEHIIEMFQEIFGERATRIKLEHISDGSGIGSAIIAAVAASAR